LTCCFVLSVDDLRLPSDRFLCRLNRFNLDDATVEDGFAPAEDDAVVALHEFKLIKELAVHHINAIFTVQELDNRAIVVSDSEVVRDNKRLELLDQAALEVA